MQRHVITLGLLVLLAACGSSDDGPASPPPAPPPAEPLVPGTQVPVAATTSHFATIAFARNSFPADVESQEPLDLGDAQFAVTDVEDPVE